MLPASESASARGEPEKPEVLRVDNKYYCNKDKDSDSTILSSPGTADYPVIPLENWNQAQKIVVAKRMLARGVSRRLIEPMLGLPQAAVQDLAIELGIGVVSDRRVILGREPPRVEPLASDKTSAVVDDLSPRPQWSPPPAPQPASRYLSLVEIKELVTRWVCGADIAAFASTLHRSDATLKRKARSLGLMGRQRDDLVKEFRAAGVTASPAAHTPARKPRKIFSWDGPQTSVLCELWTNGVPPGEIAKTLGTSPSSVSTRAVRAGLPGRKRASDGTLVLPQKGHIKFDPTRDEYFWSRRSTATQSAWRTMQAG